MGFAKIKDVLVGLKSLFIGLGVTGRVFCSKKVTVIYPMEQVTNLNTFRGVVELVPKEGAPETPKCVACGICAKACPSNCLTILSVVPPKEGDTGPVQLGPSPQKGSKTPAQFLVEFSYCSLCGQCVTACPTGCLRYSNDAYMVSYNRKDFEIDLIARLQKQANENPQPQVVAPAAVEQQTSETASVS